MILHVGRLLTGLVLVSSVVAGDESGSASQAPSVEQQVLDFEQGWVDAEMRRDAAALREKLDERFVATFGTGSPTDKDRFIKSVVGAGVGPGATQILSDRTIRVVGDTAVIVGTDTVQSSDPEKPTVYRYTATYVRRGDRWFGLGLHMVAKPPVK